MEDKSKSRLTVGPDWSCYVAISDGHEGGIRWWVHNEELIHATGEARARKKRRAKSMKRIERGSSEKGSINNGQNPTKAPAQREVDDGLDKKSQLKNIVWAMRFVLFSFSISWYFAC